jgi:hypothetical protein
MTFQRTLLSLLISTPGHGQVRQTALRLRNMALCGMLVGAGLLVAPQTRADDPIKIGSIFDLTGDLNIYGIHQSRALHLAVEKINQDGGLLGRKVEIVESDAQSQQAKYTQYANTLLMRDRISAPSRQSPPRESLVLRCAECQCLQRRTARQLLGACEVTLE